MFKMGLHCSFEYLKHKLWPKERPGIKLPVWLPTRKSRESTRFTCVQLFVCRWHATYHWKALDEGYNFTSDRISIWGLLAKLWGLQSHGNPSHLDVSLVERCRIYYKGEGGGFPQVQAVVSLMCLCCSWLVLSPKVLQLRTNHLVWVLCRPVWVSEVYQLFLVPSRSSSTPLYPSKCCEQRSVPRLLFLPLLSTWTHIWIFQGVGSASKLHPSLLWSTL
jgi:hypothetical protein